MKNDETTDGVAATVPDIMTDIIATCDAVLSGAMKVDTSFFATHGEALRLKSACLRLDVREVLRQLHSFRGEPNAGAEIARLAAAMAADDGKQLADSGGSGLHCNTEISGLDLFKKT